MMFTAFPTGIYSHVLPQDFQSEEEARAYIEEVWEGNGYIEPVMFAY